MKITVYALCYNEIKLAPFAVQYWKRFADKVVICDNDSTDGTLEYLSQFPFIEIRKYETEGLDDGVHIAIKNNIWKECRGKYDFVVVCDFDEFLYADDIKEKLQYMKDNNYTLCKPMWHNCISEKFPTYNENTLLHKQVRGGFGGSKAILFDPNNIIEINYEPGAHRCHPIGNIKEYKDDSLFCYHAVNLGLDYVLDKTRKRKERLSKNNLINGWGVHYLYDEQRIINDFNCQLKSSIEL